MQMIKIGFHLFVLCRGQVRLNERDFSVLDLRCTSQKWKVFDMRVEEYQFSNVNK